MLDFVLKNYHNHLLDGKIPPF